MINEIPHGSTGIDIWYRFDSRLFSLTSFICIQIVLPSVCMLMTMKLWTRMTLISRNWQTKIMMSKYTSESRPMSKRWRSSASRFLTSNNGCKHQHWWTVGRSRWNSLPWKHHHNNNVIYERNLDNSIKVAHTAYEMLSHSHTTRT